jgi:hypothetical protein
VIAGPSVGTAAPRKARPRPPAAKPSKPAIVPQVVLNGVGPIEWNAAVNHNKGDAGGETPEWSALRVLGPLGAESLFVFPPRAAQPTLLASWPKQEMAAHWVRIFPKYRWVVIETPADSAAAAAAAGPTAMGVVLGSDPRTGASLARRAQFYDTEGALQWQARVGWIPEALGRDLVLARKAPARGDTIPRLNVVSLPGGTPRVSWPALAGWGAASQLENFLAVNTIGLVDSATGTRQDELRLLDLEGKILWARTLAADHREFAVSNFGDVAIAREQQLVVFDRAGGEKLRVALPRNSVGRTAITPDGKFVLVASSSPVGKHTGTGIWIALYDASRKIPIWARKNLPVEGGKLTEVLELSLSDDAQRALVRLTTGPVYLLGSDGRRLASWNLERISRGEYDPGSVPRRTWLSGDGVLVAFTMPVAPSLAGARGWLFRVPR